VTGIALTVLLQVSFLGAGEPQSYAVAYKEAHAAQKPLLVLVGADWCPACRTMKQSVMPRLQEEGGLDHIAYATVNLDSEGKIARQIMQGGTIPQVILYRKTADGWKRQQLTGGQSVASMKQLLAAASEKPVATVTRRSP
jgi:thioredoxin-like negative regulator of GroEL